MHKFLTTTMVILAGAFGAASTMAATETFVFTGDCSDCLNGNGRVSAQLTLQDYEYGDPISQANFVSFRYNGSDIYRPFVIDDKSYYSVAGEMAGTGSPATFFGVNNAEHLFFSFGTGFWGLGNPGNSISDFGYSHTYSLASVPVSAAPEPAAWALVIVGVGIAGTSMRRRFRKEVSSA